MLNKAAPTSSAKARTRVLLVMPIGLTYCREALRGVRRYVREHDPWLLSLSEPTDIQPGVLQQLPLRGVITMSYDSQWAQLLGRLSVPVVNFSSHYATSMFPQVLPDNRMIGRMAASYLLERGFRHMAFCGYADHWYSHQRREGFEEAVREAGLSCHVYRAPGEGQSTDQVRYAWPAEWIASLPKPVGLLACNDHRASQLIEACRLAGRRVPEDVALLGVDNDEVMCEMADVPLSSVNPNAERLGYEAARLLDRLMAGGDAPAEPVTVLPAGVVSRTSTEMVAVADEEVSRAAQFIRRHACEPIQVADLMEHVGVSRRTLERRFKAMFSRSLHDEIRRVQFERARTLLAESDLPIPVVARRSGFRDFKRFTTLFHNAFGAPPTGYRKTHRVR
ncbi:MAG: DNA-binding transcriptional regulator [Phycisphaeraceae bacterium]